MRENGDEEEVLKIENSKQFSVKKKVRLDNTDDDEGDDVIRRRIQGFRGQPG